VNAGWLEETVWADVRQFPENLERSYSACASSSARTALPTNSKLETRREELSRRLAAKQTEKDRYVHLYAQGHISEAKLETYLLDHKNQTENLRLLLLGSVEAGLSQKREHQELTEAAHA
jgi:hypothetical protein